MDITTRKLNFHFKLPKIWKYIAKKLKLLLKMLKFSLKSY